MKFLVFLSVAVACVAADVSHLESQVPVLRSDLDISPEGNYQFGYETGNGIAAQAQGLLKTQGNEYPTLEVTGGYKYTAPDGTPVEVSYVANENGFQPNSALLPTSPPIPEAIAKSLEYIAAHPPATDYPKAAVKPSIPIALLG